MMANIDEMARLAVLGEVGESVFVDVDDTLVFWKNNQTYSINTRLVDRLIALKKNKGLQIVVWSAGGEKHARDICTEIGLYEYVSLFLTKPSYIVDDTPVDQWAIMVDPKEKVRND